MFGVTEAGDVDLDVHDEADGEDGTGEELDEPWVGCVDASGTPANNLGEQASKGQHYACRDLREQSPEAEVSWIRRRRRGEGHAGNVPL